jgi:toxin CptA
MASVLIVAYAVWLLRRESRRLRCKLTWPGGDADWRIECEGREESLRHVDASIRGGIAVLTLADGNGRRRYVWWPDTLDAKGRRALKLALAARASAATAQAGSAP